MIYSKELSHIIVEFGKLEIHRAGQQGGNLARIWLLRVLRQKSFFSVKL